MKKVSYIDSNLFSPKDAWDALSMEEKAEMMKVAVQNGITNLDDIRREYNEFAGGGYIDKAKALIKKNEGWMAKPYKDAPKGKSWRSVGYGFNDSGFYDKYPEGISRHYENGITKAQAEQELSYILNKADKHLRSIYGKQWDSFNDNQKAAIMDTYYQRPASVGKKSAFYNAVKSGKDASKYLGVNGFADRNKKRQSVFSGGAIPMVADNIDTSLSQEVALQPIVENIPEFIPLNPQAFNTTLPTYQRPELTFEEPVVQEIPISPYSPEEIERQERAEGLANLSRFLSFTNTSGSNNTFLNTIGMLTGNTFAEGGDTNDADLVDWIIREEGFNKKPEDIGDGKITLGSGLTDKKWHDLYKKRGNKWSAEDNRMAVAEEVANRRKWAEKNIPNWDTLPDSAQKALLSYKYNYNFTSANSPKLFQTLRDSNLYEAAKQMDATSKDPKFKKGLMGRRKREQEWFLSDVTGNVPVQAIPIQAPVTVNTSMLPIIEPAVSTAVTNNYVPATTTPYNRGNNMRRAFESAVAFNRMMDATSLQNNPLPEYQFPIEYANGGKIHIKPSHRGRLTELKKRTGKSEAELYKTGGPAVRKMITFARNARKWKHGLGGNLFDGTTEDSQQMMNPYRPNGGFYYVNSGGQPVNPTTRDIIELPDVVVAADKNSPSWYNRTTVGGFNENGFHESWEGIQPLVMSSSEWNRSHSANDLQTMDPYGEIPWNAAAVATGFLVPQSLASKMYNYSNKAFDAVEGYYLAHTPMKPVNTIETTALKPVVKTMSSNNSLLNTSAENVFQIKDALDKQGQVYTDNIIEYLGKYKDNHNLGKFSPKRQEYANLLKKWGVDTSKLSDGDLKTLMDDRAFNVSHYTPEGNYFIVSSENYPSFNKVKATGKNRDLSIGEINAVKDKDEDYFRVAGIHVDSNAEGGFGEGAYNSLIDYAHQVGLKGVRSGDHLQSPEKTTSTWKHYKNKVKLGTDGRHEYGTGRGITGKQHVDFNGDIYLLKENSGRILPPFKSADYVHPSLISNGRMLPPNWDIRDAFKIGIPSIGILNTLDLK